MSGIDGNTMAFTVTGLKGDTTYQFKVRGVNSSGEGAESPASDEVQTFRDPAVRGSERLARVNETIAPELARAMVSSAVEAVRMRLRQSASGNGETSAGLESVAYAMATRNEALEEGTITWREALAGTTFAHPLADDDGSGAGTGDGAGSPTVWGAADYRSLSGGDDRGLPWDGEVGGIRLGFDARFADGLLGGLALSSTEGSFDYADRTGGVEVRGTYDTSMTSVTPYAAWLSADGSSLWAMLGWGEGEVTFDDEEVGRQAGDSTMTTAAVGGSLRVTSNGTTAHGSSSSLALGGRCGAVAIRGRGQRRPARGHRGGHVAFAGRTEGRGQVRRR